MAGARQSPVSLAGSALLHLAVIGATLFTFSQKLDITDETPPVVPIDVVTIASKTNLIASARMPKVSAKEEHLRQTPPKPEPAKVEPSPPPPEPKPEKLDVAPRVEPAEAPPTPIHSVVPKPAPEPPDIMRAPEPKPEASKLQKEEPVHAPKPDTAKPVRSKAPAQPTPEVSEKVEKKVIASKAETSEKTAKKVVAPKPDASEQTEKKDDFDINKVVALLDKRDATQSSAKGRKADKAAKGFGPQTAMTMDLQDSLRSQVQQCWSPPVGAPHAEELVVEFELSLKADGSIAKAPQLSVESESAAAHDSFTRAAAEAARRAIYTCAPYKLPSDRYDQWQDITLNFDPRHMATE